MEWESKFATDFPPFSPFSTIQKFSYKLLWGGDQCRAAFHEIELSNLHSPFVNDQLVILVKQHGDDILHEGPQNHFFAF